jgi:Tfp pilus assembly PilM family ATPase
VSVKEADKLLMHGLTEKGKAPEIIKAELNNITEEIDRLIKYYQEKNETKKIDQILLCGGIGSMSGLSEYIETETKIKTKTGNPWANISVYPIKSVPRQEATLYSAAIGLCLRGLENE